MCCSGGHGQRLLWRTRLRGSGGLADLDSQVDRFAAVTVAPFDEQGQLLFWGPLGVGLLAGDGLVVLAFLHGPCDALVGWVER